MEDTDTGHDTATQEPATAVKRSMCGPVACAMVVAVALFAAFAAAFWRYGPIFGDDFGKVEYGMSRDDVQRVLGKPDRVYVATAVDPAPWGSLGCTPGRHYETAKLRSYPTPEIHANAAEVWRWSRFIDQRVGVVLDARGIVIFKWIDA